MKRFVLKKAGVLLCAAVALSLTIGGVMGCKASVSAEIGPSGDGDNSSDKDNQDGEHTGDDNTTKDDGTTTDGNIYANQPNGTLTIRNNTKKDMVLFEGETPSSDTILGGVRAQAFRAFDVSNKNDFSAGGWMIIKGMAASEYAANIDNLSNAKIEYSALATYHEGEYYEAAISSAYTGDYRFKVNNNSSIGIELHKDSFEGEKIAYLAPNKRNYYIYCENKEPVDIFPVYVYYSTRTKTVTTLNSTFFDTVTAQPASVLENVESYYFPNDSESTLQMILGSVEMPYAYITTTNSVPNQAARFMRGSTELKTQGGQSAVTGTPVTFEIATSKEGYETQLRFSLYGGNIQVLVKQETKEVTEGEDGQVVETVKYRDTPIIKNGYDYNVTLTLTGTDVSSVDSYKAIIDDGTPRNVMSEIETLPSQQ